MAHCAVDIRPFAPDDADAVVALWQVCDLTRPWNDPRKDIARKVAVSVGQKAEDFSARFPNIVVQNT